MKKPTRVPDFFIIGAPKCGTTSLCAWLNENENIFIPERKEPHHFARELVQKTTHYEYEELYKNAPKNSLCGEGSTWYLWSASAVPQIIEFNPNAKFIVCLRNPVDMYASLQSHNLFHGLETISCPESAWKAQERRIRGSYIPPFIPNPAMLIYQDACAIGTHCERLIKTASKDNIHFVFLEDMKNNPEETIRKVIEFLGLDSQNFQCSFSKENIGRSRRYPRLHRLYLWCRFFKLHHPKTTIRMLFSKPTQWLKEIALKTVERKPQKLSDKFRSTLTEHFEEETFKLERITGKPLSHWTQEKR